MKKLLLALLASLIIPVIAMAQVTPVYDMASDIQTDTTNFDNNLSAADTDVQKALETIDELVIPEPDLSAYAKLDGTNQPFTDDVEVLGGSSAKITINATPPTIGGIDTYTKLMLHFDGSDGSTTFTDSETSPKTMTPSGNAQIDTAQSKFGGASGLFDGNGDYVSTADSTDWNSGNGAFTIDCWVRVASQPATDTTMVIVGQYTFSTANRSWMLSYRDVASVKNLEFFMSANGSSAVSLQIAQTLTINQWYHLAVVRSGSIITMYLDGTSIGTYDWSTNSFYNSSASLIVGAYNGGSTGFFNGHIEELRVSKGIARWTGNFAPATQAYDATTPIATPSLVIEKAETQIAKLWTDGNASDAIKIDDATGTRVTIAQTTGNTTFAGTLGASNLSGTNTGDQDLSGYVPYTGATSDVDLTGYNLTAGSTHQAIIGDDIGAKAGYFTDGTQTASLIDGDGSNFTSTAGYSARLGSSTDAGYFNGVGGYVYLGDGSYAVKATGIGLFDNGSFTAELSTGANSRTGAPAAGFFYDGSNDVSLSDGTYAININSGSFYAPSSGGLLQSLLVNETSPYDNSVSFEVNGKGGFSDGTYSAYFATGSEAGLFTGNVNITGSVGIGVTNPSAMLATNYGGAEARLSDGGYIAGVFQSGSGYDANLGYNGYAGWFSDTTNQVYLADGTYALDATGTSHFGWNGGGGSLTIGLDGGGGLFNGIDIYESPYSATIVSTYNGYAGYFADGVNTATFADDTYAVNATGKSLFINSDQTLWSELADGTNYYAGHFGYGTYSTPNTSEVFLASSSSVHGGIYGVASARNSSDGAGYFTDDFATPARTVKLTTSSYAIETDGLVKMQNLSSGSGAPATILTNFNLYVDTTTGIVYVD